jgi:uncharacterized protein YbjT (DUF2867 family)
MKIVVIGGTGPVRSRLVATLRRSGHESLAASLTGNGLGQALAGAQAVVAVADAPASTLGAEAAARVGHHVVLSVVGADRLVESAYLRGKVEQEEAVKAGPVPYTILRATQLFESIGRIADSSSRGDAVRLPPALVQPVAGADVAATLADVAIGSPLNDTVELAGPETFRLDELARRALEANGDPRHVTPDVRARYLGAPLDECSLTPGDDARIAPTRFDDWLRQSVITAEPEGSWTCTP